MLDLNQGELILSEDPVITVNMSLSELDITDQLVSSFSQLSSKSKSLVENLYDADPEADASMKVVRVFKSNSIQSKHFLHIFSKH